MILDAHVHVGRWDDPVLGHTSTTVKELEHTLAEVGASGAVVMTAAASKVDISLFKRIIVVLRRCC